MREDWRKDAARRGAAVAAGDDNPANTLASLDTDAAGDVVPTPLSGEWAGESIPELFGLAVGEDWPDDDILTEWETVFVDSWRETLAQRAAADIPTF